MRDDALTLEKEQETDALEDSDRNREQAAPTDELRAARLALFGIRLLHLREDDGAELHDDRGGNERANTEHDDRELREPAAGKDIQKAEELVAREEGCERTLVDARDRYRGEETKQRERADEEEYTETDFRITERELQLVQERIKHGSYHRPR